MQKKNVSMFSFSLLQKINEHCFVTLALRVKWREASG